MDRRSLLKIFGLSPLVTLPVVVEAEAKLPEPAVTTSTSSKTEVVDTLEGQTVLLVLQAAPEGPGHVTVFRDGAAIYSTPINMGVRMDDETRTVFALGTALVSLDYPDPGRHEYLAMSTGGGEVVFKTIAMGRW